MPALFDSRRREYRSPFGAVAERTEVYFRICLPRCWGCHAASLLMERDGSLPRQMGMFWAGMAGEDHEYWDVRYTPAAAGIYWYGFQLELALGTGWLVRRPDGTAEYTYTTSSPRWQLTCYEAGFTTPDWLAGGILYQVFPDRFAASGTPKADVPADRIMHETWNEEIVWQADACGRVRNNDFFGGDLKGVEEKLDYLQDLGVTCLYLNPIFESHSNHRYDTADYSHIDPLLGTEQDFTSLAAAARRRGIRVVLDGVFSHTGADSVYFNREKRYPGEGAYNSPHSPYYSWYSFRSWPGDYHSWWGFDTLPEVDELSPAFMDYINGPNGITAHWLRAGASGWRLDVADELPDEFLEEFRRRVKATDPDALIMGEVWEDASNKESYGHRRRYLLGRQLDSVMNYPFRQAILQFVVSGGRTGFFNRVMDVVENYPPQVLRLLMNHIGTHDTERALTLLAGEPSRGRGRSWQAQQHLTPEQRQCGLSRLRLAALLQFALPGVPCIYYGDEAGMEGYKDPFNRRTYPWGKENVDLLMWYRRLGRCRRQCPALAQGEMIPLPSGEDVVCFVRSAGQSMLLCAVNRSMVPQRVELPESLRDLKPVLGGVHWEDGALYVAPLSGGWLENNKNPIEI